jgi:hypothetical protein
VASFDRHGCVKSLANYQVARWGRCKLQYCTGLVGDARVRVSSTVIPGGIWG